MPNQLVKSAAVATVCLLIPAVGAMAQQRAYRQAANPPAPYAYQPYQSPAATLVGTYKSDAFYPSPLILTITGADAYGNLSGTMSGWRSSWTGGETGDRWETWQRVFGRDGARALYRDGRINIVFGNGASYVLDNRGNELAGTFTADKESRRISFLKSYGVAAR